MENHENINEDTWCASQDLNQATPQHESNANPTHSVRNNKQQ
jgi:hypothetical protein